LRNDSDRCYYCKTELFAVLGDFAQREGFARILYGAIPDDSGDVRPGQRAAAEFEVSAPLIEVDLSKEQIRTLSKARELPSWNKPQAACLASRFPTGTTISTDSLRQVDAAEASLRKLGFSGHRVRHHGELARIELQAHDWPRVNDPNVRDEVVEALKRCGYKHVTIDLAGYIPAGLNR
jgi:uncharacterized protein